MFSVSINSGDHKVALLSNSTEVSVAPKTRGSTSQLRAEEKQINTIEKKPDFSSGQDTRKSGLSHLILRVLPERLYFDDNLNSLDNVAWVSSTTSNDIYKSHTDTDYVGTASLRHLISPHEVVAGMKWLYPSQCSDFITYARFQT